MEVNWKPPEIHFTSENALLRREIDVRDKYKGVAKLPKGWLKPRHGIVNHFFKGQITVKRLGNLKIMVS